MGEAAAAYKVVLTKCCKMRPGQTHSNDWSLPVGYRSQDTRCYSGGQPGWAEVPRPPGPPQAE